jgi:hypothetical protein
MIAREGHLQGANSQQAQATALVRASGKQTSSSSSRRRCGAQASEEVRRQQSLLGVSHSSASTDCQPLSVSHVTARQCRRPDQPARPSMPCLACTQSRQQSPTAGHAQVTLA